MNCAWDEAINESFCFVPKADIRWYFSLEINNLHISKG